LVLTKPFYAFTPSLVDLITHAWDYSTSHTYVIITGDRDVAYAVAMLRMRKIKVVVISSVTAHPDLTAQASIKLDWTKTVLGHQNSNSSTHFMNPPASKPPPSEKPAAPSFPSRTESPFGSQVNKAYSSAQPRRPFEATFESDSVELHDIPPRGRRHSVFSAYDPRKFEGFGDIGDPPLTPKTQHGLFGFGDGPLFPRHEEERPRAESVPPQVFHAFNLSKSVYPSFPATSLSTTSFGKGKAREYSADEPENLPPPPKIDAPYSGSVFEPFGDTATSFGAMSAFPPSEHRAATISRSSSSSSSQPTILSTVKRPDTTAPTSTKSEAVDDNFKPPVDEQRDTKVSQTTFTQTEEPVSLPAATELVPNESILPPTNVPPLFPASTSRRNSTSTIAAWSQISQATEYVPVRTPGPVLKTSAAIQTVLPIAGPSPPVIPKPALHSPVPTAQPAPSPKPKPKVPTANPSSFQPLITVMRAERGPVAKSFLGEQLVKQNARVYELAGITKTKKFKAYITAAIQAGIVSETASSDLITLSAEYRT
jgi:hypothetical protein